MVSNEQVQKLCLEATNRFGRFHKNPEVAAITVSEMFDLAEKYKTPVILESMRRTASVIKKHPELDHHRVLRAVQNIADRLLTENPASATKDMHSEERGNVDPKATMPTHETTDEQVIELQRIFSQEVGDKTLETFTVYPEEASALLAKRSLNELSAICQALGNWTWDERTSNLRFHDQNTLVEALFKRARVPMPDVVQK